MSGYTCSFCAVRLEGQDEMRAHVLSEEHGRKVRAANLDSFIQGPAKTAQNVKFRCEPCDKRFEGQIPYNQHLISEKHLKKMRAAEAITPGSPTAQDMNFIYCEPCGKKCAGEVPYNQHIISERHIKKMRESGRGVTTSIQNPQAPKLSCPICNISFENPQDSLDHTTSNEHRIRALQNSEMNAGTSKLTPEEKEDRNLLIEIIAKHKRDFLVCPADMPFMEFVSKHKIFS